MTLNEIKALTGDDINRMTHSELSQVYNKLNQTISSRISSMKKAGIKSVSPAVRMGEEYGWIGDQKPPMKLTTQQLRKVVAERKNFVLKKTSTLSGTKAYYKKITGKDFVKGASPSAKMNLTDFFKVYENMKEMYADKMERGTLTSSQIMKEIRNTWNDNEYFVEWEEWDDEVASRMKAKFGIPDTDSDADAIDY